MTTENKIPQVAEYAWLERHPGAAFVYRAGGGEEILYANARLLALFECETLDEFIRVNGGVSFRDLVYAEDLDRIETEICEQLKFSQQEFDRVEYRIVTKTGKLLFIEDFGYRIMDDVYGPLFFVYLVNAETQFVRYAMDEQTGLPGMQRFLQHVDQVLEDLPGAQDTVYQVIFFNICNFKMYNIRNGKQQGDQVLQRVAEMLQQCFQGSYASRFSGDHFVVLTKDADYLERIDHVHGLFSLHYGAYNLRLKAGVCQLYSGTTSGIVFCDYAKSACDSIRNSKEHYRIYDRTLNRRIQIGSYVLQTFDQALERGYIKLYCQPVVRTINRRLCGVEALARWEDPAYGLLSPADFIPTLEENRQIHRLDIYMIREACRQMRDAMSKSEHVVPVSINLSRLDFVECNIFQELENAAAEYEIPHDLIMIEITESMLFDDPQMMQEEIQRFHQAGYQVWMDDFGSGYSSLNILKDYQFDELKIDMGFLTSFTEKSKNIITSTVDLAKRVRMQTLAEGVETEEQFSFLQHIGCEKVQGYYFGRPMPLKETLRHCEESGLKVEKRGWRSYYDAIGRVNFLMNKPFGIVEYDGSNIRYVYKNAAYRKVLQTVGVETEEQLQEFTNSPKTPLSRRFYHFLNKGVSEEEPEALDFTINGCYMRLWVRKIAEVGIHSAYELEMINLTKGRTEELLDQRDHLYRMIYQSYDMVYLLDLSQNTIEPVISQRYRENVPLQQENRAGLERAFREMLLPSIYAADRKLFERWSAFADWNERIRTSEGGFIVENFRTMEPDGSYHWKVHRVLCLPGESADVYLYTVGYSSLENGNVFNRVAQAHGLGPTSGRWMPSILFERLVSATDLKIFWKDAERRYRGASRSFLSYFGIPTMEELLGKTTEELGWTVEIETVRKDEAAVLRSGERVLEQPETIIAKGVVHHVLTTRVPVYEDGEITGLLCCLIDVDHVCALSNRRELPLVTDPQTGLMNAYGMTNTFSQYLQRRDTEGEEFSVLRVRLPHFTDVLAEYGPEMQQLLFRKIGEQIRQVAGLGAVCARIYDEVFLICVRDSLGTDVNQMKAAVQRQILEQVHHAAKDLHIEVQSDQIRSEDVHSVPDLISLLVHAE